MTDLVSIIGGQPVTTSIVICEVFCRRHDNVLGTLNSLIREGYLHALDFKCSYRDVPMPNGGAREQRVIELTERGALLVMPFIGGDNAKKGQVILVDAFLALRSAALTNRLAPALPKMTEADVLRDENSQLKEDAKAAKAEIVRLKVLLSLQAENAELLRYKIGVVKAQKCGRRPERPVTAADRDEILRLAEEGNSGYKIAKRVQRTHSVVGRVLKNAQRQLPLGGAS